MRVTAKSLQAFYGSRLGQTARDMVLRRLYPLWGDMAGTNILGFGYCAPYLASAQKQANRIVLVAPPEQGILAHKGQRGVQSCLASETRLPFSDATFDRVLCAHAIEEADDLSGLLSELWRVTRPEGRIVIVAAGRAGLWARMDNLPFGAGRSFSRQQLRRHLHRARFHPTVGAGALYGPPVARLSGPRLARTFERCGEALWPGLAGVVMVEAIKRLYVEPDRGQEQKVRAPILGSAQPKGARSIPQNMAAQDNIAVKNPRGHR